MTKTIFLSVIRCSEEQMDKFAIHLLALSHVYSVPQLKQRCIKGLAEKLSLDTVVDVLQLARLCDAPDLHLKCMKLLSSNFRSVEETEGWKFLQNNDPYLELDILQFMDETESVCNMVILNANKNNDFTFRIVDLMLTVLDFLYGTEEKQDKKA